MTDGVARELEQAEARSQVVHISSSAYEFNRRKPAMLQINAPLETVAEIAATLIRTGALVLDEIESTMLREAVRSAAREEARTDIPVLLDYIEELEARLEQVIRDAN